MQGQAKKALWKHQRHALATLNKSINEKSPPSRGGGSGHEFVYLLDSSKIVTGTNKHSKCRNKIGYW